MTNQQASTPLRRMSFGWGVSVLLLVLYVVFPGIIVGVWRKFLPGASTSASIQVVFAPLIYVSNRCKPLENFYDWQVRLITG